MGRKFVDKNINIWLLLLLSCMCEDVLPKNPYKSGEVRADYPKGCAYLRCKRGDQCVNRKFWCTTLPCPSMLYCSKSRKESLKGPSSCESVRCTKGFVCLVKVRHCRWDEPCEQRIARCVSEKDYYDGPASCEDYKCPSGLRCILRESLCAKPPCKLVRSCASAKDIKLWHEGCKSLGCPSAQECFLRRPATDCRIHPCKHTPDCSAKNGEELEANEQCRGWVCPEGEKCSADNQGPCKRDSCRISRSCHKPLMIPVDSTPQSKRSWTDNVKLSFYSKLDKNSSMARTNRSSSNLSGNNKNSRNAAAQVIQPTVTSLSTWLNHLKIKTGVDAIEGWIKMSEKQENYEAFIDWLKSVKDMLGSVAYDLWIEEVRTMTATSPTFQKWLRLISNSSYPISPTVNEPVPITADINHSNLSISFQPSESIKSRDNENENYPPSQKIENETTLNKAINIDEFQDENYSSPRKNKTIIEFQTTEKSSFPNFYEIPQFYNQYPGLFSQTDPLLQNSVNNEFTNDRFTNFQSLANDDPIDRWYSSLRRSSDDVSRFSTFDDWQNDLSPRTNVRYDERSYDRSFVRPSIPDERFFTDFSARRSVDGDGNFYPTRYWTDQRLNDDWSQQPRETDRYILNPDYFHSQIVRSPDRQRRPDSTDLNFQIPEKFSSQRFPTNWTLPQWFPRSIPRPEITFAPSNRQWPHENSFSSRFPQVIVESTKFPNEISRPIDDEAFEGHSKNLTNDDSSWLKYFLEQTSRQSVTPEIFGGSTIDDREFFYENWPESIYQGRSLAMAPHRRTKHEGGSNDYRGFVGDDEIEKKLEIGSRNEIVEGREPFSRVRWLGNPRYRPYPRDFSSSSINRRINDRSFDRSPSIASDKRDSRTDRRWANFYPTDRVNEIVEPRSTAFFSSLNDDPRGYDAFTKVKRPRIGDDRDFGFSFGDRGLDGPIGVTDLWNAKFRTPLGSVVHRLHGQSSGYRDSVEQQQPRKSTTIATPTVATFGNEASRGIQDVPQSPVKKFANLDEDDGIYPLLLSLQGYIETSHDEGSAIANDRSNDSTILPVYAVEDAIDDENDENRDRERSSENSRSVPTRSDVGDVNLFRDVKYGGTPEFPNNLKNVLDVEAAMIINNTTGNDDVEIKDAKWEYDYDEDEGFVDDPSNFFVESQDFSTSSQGSSNTGEPDDWSESPVGSRNDDRIENDYRDEIVNYEEDKFSRLRSNYNFDGVNSDESFDHEELPEHLDDSFYDDTDRKRFKKSRP